MSNTFEEQQAEFRKVIPTVQSEGLLEFYEKAHWLLAQRAITAGLGLHDNDPTVDQQYRLTTHAVQQELLKRLYSR